MTNKILVVFLFFSNFSFGQEQIKVFDPTTKIYKTILVSSLGGGNQINNNSLIFTPPNDLKTSVNGVVSNTINPVWSAGITYNGVDYPLANLFVEYNGLQASTSIPNVLTLNGLNLTLGNSTVVLQQGSIKGDTKYGYQNNDHSGWIKLDGRAINTLTSTQQTQATNLGITGNLPDTRDKFVKATNTSNTNLGQIGGSNIMQTTLVNNNIPLMSIALPDYSTNISTYNLSGGINIPTGGNPAGGTVSSVAITSTPNSPIVSVGNNFPTPITFTNNPINIALNHFIYLGN